MSERQEILRGIIADLEKMIDKGFQIPKVLEKAKEKLNIGKELCSRNAEDYKEKNKPFVSPRNMGIGKLGSHTITLTRSFRFTLRSKLVKSLEDFIKLVKPDFTKKTLYLEVYEVNDEDKFCEQVYDWVNSMYNETDDELTLTTYDGCGNSLYEFKFSGLKTLEHNFNDFDYSSSDVLMQKVLLSYDKVVRKSL